MSFASKRSKARKITVQDEDEDDLSSSASGLMSPTTTQSEPEQDPPLQATFKSRKPFKQSALRRSINLNDREGPGGLGAGGGDSTGQADDDDQDTAGSPVVRRPTTLGRSASTKSKNRKSTSSRLSFGPSAADDDDGEDSILLGEGAGPVFTPKKSSAANSSNLLQTASENSAIKKSMARNDLFPGLNKLAMRSLEGSGDDEDRPRYSKEYLSELQNSTPNTPRNIKTLHTSEDEGMILDPEELEGAMIVDTEPGIPAAGATTSIGLGDERTTNVLTDAEIREKKQRRARLAKEGGPTTSEDFISLSDDDGNDPASRRGAGESYLTVLSRNSQVSSSKKSKESRMKQDEDDLGEGFDEFVDDGGLSLGRKAEREARRKQRADIASMIATAEGVDGDDDNDESDDSEAERRAAYEKAQTRAGMDGLKKPSDSGAGNMAGQVPPKITQLPDLSVLVGEFKAKMARKEVELQRMRARINELKAEREGVLRREPEVQKLLNEAGERYKRLTMPGAAASASSGAVEGGVNGSVDGAVSADGGLGEGGIAAARSLLDRARGGDTPVGARGLDSLGTTPTRRQLSEEMEF